MHGSDLYDFEMCTCSLVEVSGKSDLEGQGGKKGEIKRHKWMMESVKDEHVTSKWIEKVKKNGDGEEAEG